MVEIWGKKCPHCKTIWSAGDECPTCGCRPLSEREKSRYERELTSSSHGRCKECGGKLVDITVSCPRIVCEVCGKEDK